MPNLTTAQVAVIGGVSVRKVHRMVQAGKLKPAQQLPGHTGAFLFRPSEVRRAFPDAVMPESEAVAS